MIKDRRLRKEIRHAKAALAWKRFYTNKLALGCSAMGVGILAGGCYLLSVFLTEGLAGIIRHMTDPLAYVWYAIIVAVIITLIYVGVMKRSRGGR